MRPPNLCLSGPAQVPARAINRPPWQVVLTDWKQTGQHIVLASVILQCEGLKISDCSLGLLLSKLTCQHLSMGMAAHSLSFSDPQKESERWNISKAKTSYILPGDGLWCWSLTSSHWTHGDNWNSTPPHTLSTSLPSNILRCSLCRQFAQLLRQRQPARWIPWWVLVVPSEFCNGADVSFFATSAAPNRPFLF